MDAQQVELFMMKNSLVGGRIVQIMKQIHIFLGQDYDKLTITKTPILIAWFTWLLCYSRLAVINYELFDRLMGSTYKYEKELYRTKIESGCLAAFALWGKDEDCLREDCSNHERSDETN